MSEIYLITGGVRCGKSRLGLKLAEKALKPFFIATAWAGDDEMDKRIRNHKAERDEKWTTIEEPYKLAEALKQAKASGADLVVIDCITLWTSNVMFSDNKMEDELSSFIAELNCTEIDVVMVTNEVGFGIVPDNQVSRDYRDLLGLVNQKLAETATNVTLMVSGIPVKIK